MATGINSSMLQDLAVQSLKDLSLSGAVFDTKIGLIQEEIDKDFLQTINLNDKFILSAENVVITNYDK